MKINTNHLPDIIGKGYKTFWHFKGRYRVVKGSRASKKSKTAALWFVYNLMKCPDSNLLVIRKVFRTIKDSCFTELKWAINRLGVQDSWDIKESPLEMTYKPTGQKIYFRGLDDPLKITSITVGQGVLCWGWVEEAYEIAKEADFDIIDESLRGDLPPGLFYQWTLTFNPWNERHWLKKRFFDAPPKEKILAITTNYLINEFIDKDTLDVFEEMKLRNLRRYQVAGLGNWGVSEGLVYEKWKETPFDLNKIKKIKGIKSAFGLDFGYTNDPSALCCMMVDLNDKIIYVFDEMYQTGMSNEAIAKTITRMGYGKERITADCAEPKSIDRLSELGLRSVKASKKGADSVANGIDFIQDFKILIHPQCVNFLTEIGNYTWADDKLGNKINKPIGDFKPKLPKLMLIWGHLIHKKFEKA